MTETVPPATLNIENDIARLTLNRPDRLNAFTGEMHRSLREAISAVEAAPQIRAVILTGAGRGFCVGQDLRERASAIAQGIDVDLHRSLDLDYNPLIRRLAALSVPVIAAVNGPAAGAGAALAIGCDIVLAARSASFQFSFAKVALGPDCGTSWLLPRIVGRTRALALMLTAEPVSAEEAERIGLVWKSVNDEALEGEATRLAEMLVRGPRTALAAIKRQVRAASEQDFYTALDSERDAQGELGRHPDYRAAVTAFAERRTPSFSREN